MRVIPSLILGLGLAFPTASLAQDDAFAGPHVGVLFGYGWGEKVWDLNDPFATFAVDSHMVAGWPAGLEAGIRFGTSAAIFGFEASIARAGISGEGNCTLSAYFSYHGDGDVKTYVCLAGVHWLATATAQFGIASGGALFYAEAGVVLARETFGAVPYGDPVTITNQGWLVGAGVVFASGSGLTFSIEYNYIDFGTYTLPLYNDFGPVPVELSQNLHLVTFGIGRQF